MTEYENSKSDDQLEELLMLTEQMQEELDQKDRTIEKLKMQIDESLTLNEKLNSENKAGNIQALKNDLRKTKELLQSEKEKTHAAEIMTEECQDKLRQAEQERDYALSHQKKVEIPVEKPVLYFFLMGECIIPFLFCLSLLISTFLYHGLDGVCFLFLALQQFFCFPQVVL